MKKEDDKTSEGLNQIFEIINAKGDTGELKEIIGEMEKIILNKECKTWKFHSVSVVF